MSCKTGVAHGSLGIVMQYSMNVYSIVIYITEYFNWLCVYIVELHSQED